MRRTAAGKRLCPALALFLVAILAGWASADIPGRVTPKGPGGGGTSVPNPGT